MFFSQKCEEKILEESGPLVINHIITFYCLGYAETVSPAAGNASGATETQSSFHGSQWRRRPVHVCSPCGHSTPTSVCYAHSALKRCVRHEDISTASLSAVRTTASLLVLCFCKKQKQTQKHDPSFENWWTLGRRGRTPQRWDRATRPRLGGGTTALLHMRSCLHSPPALGD